MLARIYNGINNIYRIRTEAGKEYEARIKGKVLKGVKDSYNPLVPGDQVICQEIAPGKALILERCPRENRFARWNKKWEDWQAVVSNFDLLLVVTSALSPPFRPRFVDRVLITAQQGGASAGIVLNKTDEGIEDWVCERLTVWEKMGIPLFFCSAKMGEGIEVLSQEISGKAVAFFGQSGVGKSTLINRLLPGQNLSTAELSKKHSRGKHTTNVARMFDLPNGGWVVDTPGIRGMLVQHIKPMKLSPFFPDFDPFVASCHFSPCSHWHEPNCGVRRAVSEAHIHPDRYDSYLSILQELYKEKTW